MAIDANLKIAPMLDLSRGMASSPSPRLIGQNQAALLINCTVRGGFPHPRPCWIQRALTYESASQATIIEAGRWQGGTYFTPRNGTPALYACINGRQFRFNVWTDYSTQEVSAHFPGDPTDPINLDANSSTTLQTWWCDTGDFLLMQNGQDPVWCHDGSSSWRLGPFELPVGCMMEYALGRIWVVLPDRLSFVAGDLIGSASGTAKYNYRDAVLKMTENDFLNEGGGFSVPSTAGMINAIRYMPNLDSSLGQGPVQVFTDNGAFSVNAPFDRMTWKNLTYPIQTVSLGSPGALAQDSTIRINGDIWYRGIDGIRSFIVARRDYTMWGNVPMSEEMKRVLKYDATGLLIYGSAVMFDNRMLMTANPRWNATRGVLHDTLAVMDFDLISSLGQRSQPCWDGMWTGKTILQIIKGSYRKEEKCWAFVFNNTEGNIELWELMKKGVYDQPATLPKERIKWGGESRLNDYGSPGVLKSLETLDVEAASIEGTVDFVFKYRSDDAPCWQPWSNFQLCAKDSDCPPAACTPQLFRKSYRSRVTLPKPAEACNDSQQRPSTMGLRNQIRWEITGACELRQMASYSRLEQQPAFVGCEPESATCTEDTCCPENNNFLSEE